MQRPFFNECATGFTRSGVDSTVKVVIKRMPDKTVIVVVVLLKRSTLKTKAIAMNLSRDIRQKINTEQIIDDVVTIPAPIQRGDETHIFRNKK